jgi:hypothetical protein
MSLFSEERMIHHDPSQLNDASYGWQTMPELEHLRTGAVLWQPNVSCKYSAICAQRERIRRQRTRTVLITNPRMDMAAEHDDPVEQRTIFGKAGRLPGIMNRLSPATGTCCDRPQAKVSHLH